MKMQCVPYKAVKSVVVWPSQIFEGFALENELLYYSLN